MIFDKFFMVQIFQTNEKTHVTLFRHLLKSKKIYILDGNAFFS